MKVSLQGCKEVARVQHTCGRKAEAWQLGWLVLKVPWPAGFPAVIEAAATRQAVGMRG